MHWMILPLKRYAEFSGRSRRMEYWMFFLLQMIVAIVLIGTKFTDTEGLMEIAANQDSNPLAVYGWMFSGITGILLGLWFLATLIPNIAVNVRRLHDRDMSGWWYLGFVVASMIPFIGIIASIAYLVIMLLPGTPGPNRFGPDPKGVGNDAGVFE